MKFPRFAIDEFYSAFSDSPKPEVIYGCPCCIGEKELDKLVNTPLREITPDDLSTYAADAFLTIGDVEDYSYLLPRILEISIYDEWYWPSFEITARAIISADLHNWREDRRLALFALLKQVIVYLVENDELHHRIDEWMCGIGRMEIDVVPFLSLIETNEAAVLAYWKENAGKLHEGKLGNPFWELPNDQHDKIVRWFETPKINLIYAKEYGYRMN